MSTITFRGSASDFEDGDLTTGMTWYSDDVLIGTTGSCTAILPDGTHTITARAIDSHLKTGSASVQITVGAVSPVTYEVGSITYGTEGGKGGKAHLKIGVPIIDGSGTPVAGATVSISVTRNGSLYYSGSAVTATNGVASFKLTNAPTGTYETTVNSLLVGGQTSHPSTPPNFYVK